MNVNATLFVQIGNFYIAYLLFRYILLRPGYKILMKKQSHQRALEDEVTGKKQQAESERQKQKEAWILFREWSKTHLPAQLDTSAYFHEISDHITIPEISKEQRNTVRAELISAMRNAIKERYER